MFEENKTKHPDGWSLPNLTNEIVQGEIMPRGVRVHNVDDRQVILLPE